MQLSPNQEIFSHFFPEFLKSPQNLEYYEKNDDPQRFLKLYTATSAVT